MWRCPLCTQLLQTDASPWQCKNRHSFDRSKSGYVNLLPVQKKNSRHPGDDKAMVKAREVFHSFGSYQPLMAYIADVIAQQSDKLSLLLFDAGCGEGSYLADVIDNLCERGIKVNGAGCDIAKPAVERAARQHKDFQFVVASTFDLPLCNASIDALISVFAPGSTAEYARVLSDRGLFIQVQPGPRHLLELKAHVYEQPRLHQQPGLETDGFTLLSQEQISYALPLAEPEHREALLSMTPFVWRTSPQKREQIIDTLTQVTADFYVTVYRKNCLDEKLNEQ